MKWDGKFLEDVVKERLYSLLWKMDITKALTMKSNKEYASFLKSVHSNAYCHASNGGGGIPTIIGRTSGIIIEFTDRTFDDGDNIIELSWSMAARHIRAWEFEKNREKPQSKKEDKAMARKFEFDSAITADMKRASDDSFADNIKMIDISEITPSMENFYEIGNLELLADDIEREGLKHNLVVVKDGSKYRVKGGHRRLAAIKLLIEQKRRSNTKVPCYVDGSKTEAEAQFDLIMLNATQRKYSDADILHEYEEIERTFKALEAEGKPLKGRIRDNIAAALKVSPAQIGKIENIKHNAIPEVEQAVKSGTMSISTANEVAKLSEDTQKEIIEKQPEITNKEIKAIQEEKAKPETKKSASKSEKEIPSPAQIVSDNEEENIFDIEDDDTDDEIENEDCDTYSTNDKDKNSDDETSSLSYTFSLSYNQADKLLEFLTNEGAEQTYPQLETVIYKLKTMLGKLS